MGQFLTCVTVSKTGCQHLGGVPTVVWHQPWITALLETQLPSCLGWREGHTECPRNLPPLWPRVRVGQHLASGQYLASGQKESAFHSRFPNSWGGASMIQGLAVTLGWKPRGWGVSRPCRTKLGISHWPLLQGRNLSPWLPWKWITFPLLSNQSPVWQVLSP